MTNISGLVSGDPPAANQEPVRAGGIPSGSQGATNRGSQASSSIGLWLGI